MSQPSDPAGPGGGGGSGGAGSPGGRTGAAGLPPHAAERLAEARSSGTWSSALSTGAFAAVRSVGFEPVGQVMGSAVFHIGRSGRYWGYHDCLFPQAGYGRLFSGGARAPVALSGRNAPSAALVQVFDQARRTALGRMTEECAALGGDGVVSAQLTVAPFPAQPNCLEFQVIGTAVRARGEVRPRRPFTCHMDGPDFAKLVRGGWVPVELLFGMSVGVRHDDYGTQWQSSSWVNSEVAGWSELVHGVRADAREHIARQARRSGADGLVLANGELEIWGERCIRAANRNSDSEQEDHVAQVVMVGTAIARFHRSAPPTSTMAVLPLGNRGDRLRKRLAQAAASPYGDRERIQQLARELREAEGQG